jgi:hypothetical protein
MKASLPSVHFGLHVRLQLACAPGLLLSAMLSSASDGAETQPQRLVTPPIPTTLTPTNPTSTWPRIVQTPAQRLTRRINTTPLRMASTGSMATHDLPDIEFRANDAPVHRLAHMRSLPVMTLWQSPRTQVYLGVDRKGLAGLHFRQRRNAYERHALWRSFADSDRRSAGSIPAPALRSVSP